MFSSSCAVLISFWSTKTQTVWPFFFQEEGYKPCKTYGVHGSYIKVLASFGLAAEMIKILGKAVQAQKKKPKIELSHILKATRKSVALALVAFSGP